MHSPLVSILVPTYEPDPAHLTETLSSIKRQTFEGWTVLIHDDASNANVEAMAKPFLSDPRFRFTRSDKRLGIGGNWNACLKQADAPYIQFLFQDDTWEATYLEKSVAILEREPSVGMTAALHRYVIEGDDAFVDAKRHVYESIRAAQEEMLPKSPETGASFLTRWIDRGLHPNVIGEPSFVMLRRTLTELVGTFDESMPQNLDMDYWIRCLPLTTLCSIINELGAFRVHAQATSMRNFEAGSGIYDRLHMFEKLLSQSRSDTLKNKVSAALRSQLVLMIGKFFERRSVSKTNMRSNGYIRTFALRHPIMMTEALLRYASGKRVPTA